MFQKCDNTRTILPCRRFQNFAGGDLRNINSTLRKLVQKRHLVSRKNATIPPGSRLRNFASGDLRKFNKTTRNLVRLDNTGLYNKKCKHYSSNAPKRTPTPESGHAVSTSHPSSALGQLLTVPSVEKSTVIFRH